MNDAIPLTYKTIPRILCATDLSPHCEGAVRRATLLAANATGRMGGPMADILVAAQRRFSGS